MTTTYSISTGSSAARCRNLLLAVLVGLACSLFAVYPAAAEPVKTHPRLWVRAQDIADLQSRMLPSNPVWVAFKSLVDQALADWQQNIIPEQDLGWHTGNITYQSELWGMVFAFMSLIEPDPVMRQTYTTAAKEVLMYTMDQAYLGPGTPNGNGSYPPFRHPDFTLADRGFYNEAYPLMVDWLQAQPGVLDADDMGKIRKTFLWWAHEAEIAPYFSPSNPNHLVNDPSLLKLAPPASQYEIDTRTAVRDALNNHYANRLRTQMSLAMALDPADDVPQAPGDIDPPGTLTGYIEGATPDDWVYTNTGYLRSGTGTWLYLTDYGLRHDTGGGMSPEGLQYMSNGLGPLAFAMLMLHTAGQDDPNQWGPQVVLDNQPFWEHAVDAYLHQLPPATRLVKDWEHLGPLYDLAWYGDGENYYQNDQFIKILAPLALYDRYKTGDTNAPRTQAVRYIQQYIAEGGASRLASRINGNYGNRTFRDAISYFLLFDPSAAPAADPRTTLPKTAFASFNDAGSQGSIHSRTGLDANQSYFDYRLGWARIDHQHGDGNSFELWRNGVWLTKRWIGYGGIAANSDYNNALAIENNPLPGSDTFFYHKTANRHGGQYTYSQSGDATLLAKSLAQNFLYVSGDSTKLYNIYADPVVNDVLHASRSIVWLKPDYVVVYDRAKTASSGRFKRFWLALSDIPQISGNTTHTTVTDTHYVNGVLTSTPKAELFTSTLLPAGAPITYDQRRQMTYSCKKADHSDVDCDTADVSQCVYIDPTTNKCSCPDTANLPSEWNGNCPCQCGDQTASGEPMDVRLRVDAPGDPAEARFLHVLQGADLGGVQSPASHFASSAGASFDGALVNNTAVLFPVDVAAPFSGLTYSVPAATTSHLITGLAANATYYVTQQSNAGSLTVSVSTSAPGTPAVSDSGGVLVLGPVEPANISITATDNSGAEAGSDPITFTLNRSGSTGADLAVHYVLSGNAGNGIDYNSLSGIVTIPAGSSTATLTVTPIDDGDFEGAETVTVTLSADPSYYAADGVNSASGEIADDDPPPGGFLQFGAPTFSVAENGTTALLTVVRSGSTSGPTSVLCSSSNGSALAGSDFQSTAQTLSWGSGDAQAKTCAITILDDATYEDDETAMVKLSNVTGQAALGTPSTATLTIIENDPAPIGQIVLNTAAITVGEAGGQVSITIKRINGKGGPASVTYSTINGSAVAGSDFTAKAGTVSWNNNENFDQTITIPITSDTQFEGGSESFSFTLSNPTIPLAVPASAIITITDDDPQPLEYDVGPGYDFTTVESVPWQSLVAGSVVRIHAEGSPYHGKFMIAARGTVDQPIRVIGISANGARPILDGSNALPNPSQHYLYSGFFTESHSIVAVSRDAQQSASFKPGYIEIENLEIRNANGNYVDTQGQSQAYSSNASGILIQSAEHVSVRNCVVHDAANGIVVESQGSEADVSRDITIEGNQLYNLGWVGQYNGRGIQVHAAAARLQYNKLAAPLTGNNVENIEDRGSGTVIRYNWIEGGAPTLQTRESGSSIIRAETDYDATYVYGNILLDGPHHPSTLLSYGGSTDNGYNRKGTLYFFHNTVVIDSTQYEPSMFALATNAEHVDARNNLFFRNPSGVSPGTASIRILPGVGTATLGRNWISSAWQAGPAVTYSAADITTGSNPGFVSYATGDLHLAALAAARDLGGALHPNVAVIHDVIRQYLATASSELRPIDAIPDLGAFEFGVPPVLTPTQTPTTTTTQTPTSSPSQTPTRTPEPQHSSTPTLTPTQTATLTPTNTNTPTNTATATASATPAGCNSGIPIERASLKLVANPFSLKHRGQAVIPKPWAQVDPIANGVRLRVTGLLDVTIPGGSLWTKKGTRWVYRDSSGALAGITGIVINDRSAQLPGRIKWAVKAKGGSLSLPAADQIQLSLTLGNDSECAGLAWNGPSQPKPHCIGNGSRITCR